MNKQLFLLLVLASTFSMSALAKFSDNTGFEAEYLPHTTKQAIDFKKADALQWYGNNIDKKKFYFINHHSADKEVAYMKNEALTWYEDNVDKKKFYFINHHSADKEIAFLKKRALKWHERNSQL